MSTTKPKIILTGTYSSFNKGDAAMQISTAQQIKKLWPGAEVVISTPFPEFDHELYKNYTVIKSSRRNLLFSTLQIIRAKAYCFFKRFKVDLKFLVNNIELRQFRDADIIIDLSGDTLTEDYGPHVTYSHFLPIWLALSFRKPVFVCAQSIGPFKLTKLFSRHLLNKTTKITAREEITYKYLLELGVDKKLIEQTSDMAFLLEPANDKHIREVLGNEKLDKLRKPILGITISNLVVKRFNKNNSGEDFIKTIAAILDRFITEHNATVLLLGHVTGPSAEKDDRLVAKKIKRHMQHTKHVFALNGNYSPGELKGIISKCDIFMGSRMHSNIAALSSGVPIVAISYSHKTQGIMSLFDMDENVLDIDKLDKNSLFETLDRAYKFRSQISRKLEAKIPGVKSSSERNLEIIERYI